ncbi:hypothetical protein XELAEV_18032035mg [Xenopus laevis]|uniref:Uncharacterized protein n=1 Tax=Xenopus laevis TaxID=8355 RepID=A0A974HGN5_XENLA|nr:hypothetical protein XELAEV_18032035mg [Xenopus laevis]
MEGEPKHQQIKSNKIIAKKKNPTVREPRIGISPISSCCTTRPSIVPVIFGSRRFLGVVVLQELPDSWKGEFF